MNDFYVPRGFKPETVDDEVEMEDVRPGRTDWPFQIGFFAQEEIGFSIGHVGGLARADFG